jgi:hypothetical protein
LINGEYIKYKLRDLSAFSVYTVVKTLDQIKCFNELIEF